jgi:hypothetical protein
MMNAATKAKKQRAISMEPLRLFLDFGNHSLKYIYEGDTKPKSIRAWRFDQFGEFKSRRHVGTEQSPVVCTKGNIYFFGDEARLQGEVVENVKGNKADQVCPGFLAAIDSRVHGKQLKITMTVPNLELFEATALADTRKKLLGSWDIIRNGEEISFTVIDLEVEQEGLGSFYMAKDQGLLKEGLTLLIDLGCGTAISAIFNAEGKAIKQKTLEDVGMIDLCKRIADGLSDRLTETPKERLIMQGIEDGTYSYGTTGVDFTDLFEQNSKVWLKRIMDTFISEYSSVRSEIRNILVTGGTSLVATAINPKLIRVDSPIFANILGLANFH